MKQPKVIISGGGTGGHIFPAIAIANEIRRKYPDSDILFVGAEDRMEMEKVPAAGYKIIGLPVAGFDRKKLWKNIGVLLKLNKSMRLARKTIKDFRPDVVIGVGGYASGPTLKVANQLNIPTVLQEQNSYAGVTNKLLAEKAARICVAYKGMEAFFPKDKIVLTGNPVRQDLLVSEEKRQEAYTHFNLDPNKKTILILGGSLGARTINQSIIGFLEAMAKQKDVQFLWQSGKLYYPDSLKALEAYPDAPIRLTEFISRMDLAYSLADVIVSRAGAGSISEFCLLGKPVILIPSPNVAEDHQTKNAMALVKKKAAHIIHDKDAIVHLIPDAISLIRNTNELGKLRRNIKQMALPKAARKIVEEIEKVWEIKENQMKIQNDIKAIYFIGIGGIGMSALARYFLSKGIAVGGYDRTSSQLTKQLEQEGAIIHYEDSVELVLDFLKAPKGVKGLKGLKEGALIVYTPAIPDTHTELNYFRSNGFKVLKRSEVLGEITRKALGICVAGTHGKTTVSAMIAHLLKQSHVDCSALLGGILNNYDSNLLLSEKSDRVVVEADEYDRSFHTLSPEVAVITSITPDHLDIYGTEEAYREAFIHFTSLIKDEGLLLIEKDVDIPHPLHGDVPCFIYSGDVSDLPEEDRPDFYAENVRIANGTILFDFVVYQRESIIRDIELGVPLEINIKNAVAALAIAEMSSLSHEELKEGMRTFKGVKRRFDFHIKTDRLVLIDDYAHHPEELEASISSVKKLYPDKKLTVVFQPHLYSRTRDFGKEFSAALSLADQVILIPIYPAREEPIPGVCSEMLLEDVTAPEKLFFTKEELVDNIAGLKPEVVLMAGAGDIELLVEPVKDKLMNA